MSAAILAKANGTQASFLINGASAFTFDTTGVDSPTNVTATATGGVLTISLAACGLRFRNTSASVGLQTYLESNAAISLTVPALASLGVATTTQARLAVIACANGGQMILAIANLAGGVNIDGSVIQAVSLIAGTSLTANAIWGSVAIASAPIRVVGFIDATWVSGTGWTVTGTVQSVTSDLSASGYGSIGVGQTWQNVTGSRASGVTYYNTTGKSIMVYMQNAGVTSATFGGVTWTPTNSALDGFIVPPGGSYSIVGTLSVWLELR